MEVLGTQRQYRMNTRALGLESDRLKKRRKNYIVFKNCKSESVNLPTREHTAVKKFT